MPTSSRLAQRALISSGCLPDRNAKPRTTVFISLKSNLKSIVSPVKLSISGTFWHQSWLNIVLLLVSWHKPIFLQNIVLSGNNPFFRNFRVYESRWEGWLHPLGVFVIWKSKMDAIGSNRKKSLAITFEPWCIESWFLAATKQLYEWFSPSVCLSVRLSVTPFWLCSHHRIIMKFSGVITSDRSDVHAKGQGQKSKVKVTTQLYRFRTVTPVWIHIWWWNDAYSLIMVRRGALLFFKVIRQISRSHGSKNCRIWPRLGVSGL